MLTKIAGEMSENVVCGVVPHPSFQLEDAFYGGSAISVLANVKKPILLMPAGNDSDNVRAGVYIYIYILFLYKHKFISFYLNIILFILILLYDSY